MSSADPAAAPLAQPLAPARGAERGFTLLEVMLAFAILSIALSFLVIAQRQSFASGAKALDLRDVRGMLDTVFRRIVYEEFNFNDGDTNTADVWYAEFAGFRGAQRDRWRVYRLVLTKRKGLVTGTDPSGRLESLFREEDYYDRDRYGEPRDRTQPTTSGGTTSGTMTTTTTSDPETASGESAYRIVIDVYVEGEEKPIASLRTIVPLSEEERAEDAEK